MHRLHGMSRPNAVMRIMAVLTLLCTVLSISAAPGQAEAQQTQPTIGDTARLLGYLFADGSYNQASGVWDATGPSGGAEIIQRLVIVHGGSWVDRQQLKFTLPAPYDWAEWKDSIPNDDARTREAVQHPNFLAALLEGEGSTTGLVYDQSACCTAGFKRGRLTGLRDLLLNRGFATTTLTTFGNVDSGRIDIAASEFAKLRSGHQFVCPTVGSSIRVPGAENFAAYGPIRWFNANTAYNDVVRTDCVDGKAITASGPPVGDCVVTSDGNGRLRLTWTHNRGNVAIRRSNSYVTAVSALDKVFVDAPAAGSYNYTIRVTADGQRSDFSCGVAATNDPFQAAPPPGQMCNNRVVTVMGTGGADQLEGTSGVDVIHAFGGDDAIFGLQGNDIICGGSGNDTVYAGKGNDVVLGGQGFDVLFGAQGNDILRAAGLSEVDSSGSRMFGGEGNDTIVGSSRWDRMQGGPGNDIMQGFQGRDWMRGGPGNDRVVGHGGIDDLHGGNGIDFIQVQDKDVVRGGAGRDGCRYDTLHATQVFSCEVRLTNQSTAAFIAALTT